MRGKRVRSENLPAGTAAALVSSNRLDTDPYPGPRTNSGANRKRTGPLPAASGFRNCSTRTVLTFVSQLFKRYPRRRRPRVPKIISNLSTSRRRNDRNDDVIKCLYKIAGVVLFPRRVLLCNRYPYVRRCTGSAVWGLLPDRIKINNRG